MPRKAKKFNGARSAPPALGRIKLPEVEYRTKETSSNCSNAPQSPAAVSNAVNPGTAPKPKTTIRGASRDRLAKTLGAWDLWNEFEEVTGERVDPLHPPTWAEMIVARLARRAATSENGTRDAKELREAAEGSESEPARVAFLLSLDGLPRTNAVTGKPPQE